jgi:hypothetical protein
MDQLTHVLIVILPLALLQQTERESPRDSSGG